MDRMDEYYSSVIYELFNLLGYSDEERKALLSKIRIEMGLMPEEDKYEACE